MSVTCVRRGVRGAMFGVPAAAATIGASGSAQDRPEYETAMNVTIEQARLFWREFVRLCKGQDVAIIDLHNDTAVIYESAPGYKDLMVRTRSLYQLMVQSQGVGCRVCRCGHELSYVAGQRCDGLLGRLSYCRGGRLARDDMRMSRVLELAPKGCGHLLQVRDTPFTPEKPNGSPFSPSGRRWPKAG